MVTVWTLLIGLISGFLGWILSEFFAKPLRRGLDLAAEAKAAFIEYANVSARNNEQGKSTDLSEKEEARLQEAEARFRKLSACLYAFAQTDHAASKLLEKTMFDVEYAATAMMQLSNNIGTYGKGRHESIAIARDALKVRPFGK